MSDPSRSLFNGCRRMFVAVAVFSFFTNLLIIAVPLYSLQVFDRVLSSHNNETLVMLTIVTLGALLFLGIIEAMRSRLLVHLGTWLEATLSPKILRVAVSAAPLSPIPADGQGLRDVATLRGFVAGQGILHLLDAPWVPVYIVIAWMLHPILGWITASGAVILAIIAFLNEFLTRSLLRQANQQSVGLMRWAEDALRNAEVIESLGMMPNVIKLWQKSHDVSLRYLEKASHRAGGLAALARFSRLGIQVLITGVGIGLVVQNQLTAGAVIAASIILSRALAPVEQLVGSWKSFISARGAYARLTTLLQAKHSPRRGETILPIPKGRLTIDRLSLVLPDRDRPVLSHLCFDLPAGESLGIVGPSAAGKSSLARVILGLWPGSSGKVRLDGADVHSWNREDLGRHIGYLPQDVELFPGTIKQNIARMGYGHDEAVIAAAQMAGAHDMILSLPLGYDSDIGHAARILSGGQKQRLGLARAFYGDPKLLVLDEPNANLDAQGEEALVIALHRAKERGITVVVIAHRPRVLQSMDKLLFLREGRMELFGAKDEVMARLSAPSRPNITVETPMVQKISGSERQ